MLIKLTKPLTEAAIKYFLVQAIASTLIIVRVASNLFSSQALVLETSESLLLVSLLIKAGTPPLHFWFTDISTKLNWSQCIILFT
jgi:NADH:ubiquinone oxidoreductase subunit 2 (subunit N)